MELRNRVVLVTGAAKRVGRAIALRLARHGCKLAIHYRYSAAEAAQTLADAEAAGAEVALFQADFLNLEACAALVSQVVARFGGMDVLINNAANFERMTIDSFDPAAWRETLQINLTAPVQLAHAARDSLRRRGGVVVNMCDMGVQRPAPTYLAYSVAKAGLETLTRMLAKGLAPEARAVGVAPGIVEWPEDYDTAKRERLLKGVPLGRAGTPEDVAALVEYLLREGDYISGAIIPLDGGRSVT